MKTLKSLFFIQNLETDFAMVFDFPESYFMHKLVFVVPIFDSEKNVF